MRLKRIVVTTCFLIACSAAFAVARPATRFDEATQTCRVLNTGPLEMASRAYGEGGRLFTALCKSCHYRDNDKGASFLWAESKTSAAWNRVFAQRYPQCAKDGKWDTLTQEQLLRVNDYLYRFSFDSQNSFDNC
jgi:hypothetical protein